MGYFKEYTEPNDPMDSPIYEAEREAEKQKYWQDLDNRRRWSE